MHPHERLLMQLFEALNRHDPDAMARCYHEHASFEDIAFRLEGREQIHAMWDMICSDSKDRIPSDIRATVEHVSADDSAGRAVVVEHYTYRDTGHPVSNRIVSTFVFQQGLISRHRDACDAAKWAEQALGGITGFVAGHIEFIRRAKAMGKLRAERPEAFRRQVGA